MADKVGLSCGEGLGDRLIISEGIIYEARAQVDVGIVLGILDGLSVDILCWLLSVDYILALTPWLLLLLLLPTSSRGEAEVLSVGCDVLADIHPVVEGDDGLSWARGSDVPLLKEPWAHSSTS